MLGASIGIFKLIAEFYNVEAAKFAVKTLNKTTVKEIYIEVGLNQSDVQVHGPQVLHEKLLMSTADDLYSFTRISC